MGNNNRNLHRAKKEKNDEFYTLYEDIEAELQHYIPYFKNKKVYINCDNPLISNFWKFFTTNFKKYKLKKLYCSWYEKDNQVGRWVEYTGGEHYAINMNFETGDFREYDWLIDKCDIVVGNPPFSLFREFIDRVKNKDFLVIGNMNAITFKCVYPLIFSNYIKLGYNKPTTFFCNNKILKANTYWFTTLPVEDKPFLELTATYDPVKYPKYDNYDAINVDKVADIPKDYYGVMGVPITFLDKYNKKQFKLVGFRKGRDGNDLEYTLISDKYNGGGYRSIPTTEYLLQRAKCKVHYRLNQWEKDI